MANLSRRFFLGAGAAATLPVAAVSTAALITNAAQAQPLATPIEEPSLLALGADLDRARGAFILADSAKTAARARADALCPAVPPDLVVDKDVDHWCCGQREIDIEDRPIYQANERQRVIATVGCLTIDTEDYGPRTKIGKKARRMLKVAQAYEQAIVEAKARSGLTAAI